VVAKLGINARKQLRIALSDTGRATCRRPTETRDTTSNSTGAIGADRRDRR
jgi:hypothetical protein